ncbi:MAG: D-cysteine desulfhydrase [Oceanospirillaceae bacterium]
MIDFSAIARVDITHGNTALEFAPRLSAELGCKLYFKRDDCTGLAGGGNKTRKLEYLMADALQQKADTIVTLGGLQSNHARQSAAAAAKFGLGCELVLEDVAGTPKADFYSNGNLFLNTILGANIHKLGVDADLQGYSDQLLIDLEAQGKKPYFIPIGGSNVIGSLGYVRCALEIVEQLNEQKVHIDQIVIASGSSGTQAGLLAGLIMAGSDISVLGISVSKTTEHQARLVTELLLELLEFLEIDPALAKGKVHTNGNYFGEGYGVSTTAMVDAVKLCASKEGILLDPVYTGKAMAGFIDLLKTQQIDNNASQLFLHTGGSAGLFAYQEVFN